MLRVTHATTRPPAPVTPTRPSPPTTVPTTPRERVPVRQDEAFIRGMRVTSRNLPAPGQPLSSRIPRLTDTNPTRPTGLIVPLPRGTTPRAASLMPTAPGTPTASATPTRPVAAPSTPTVDVAAPSTPAAAPTVEVAPTTPGASPAPASPPVIAFSLDENSLSAVNIVDSSAEEVRAAISGAIEEINRAAGRTLIDPTVGTTSINRAAADDTNVISFAPEGFDFGENSVAVAGVFTDAEKRVVSADVLFNPRRRFSTADEGATEQQTFDIQGILTHELMHTLGVGHLDDPDSTMSADATPSNDLHLRTLERSDITALLSLFG